MKRKIYTVLFACMLTAAVSACGSSGSTDNSITETASSTEFVEETSDISEGEMPKLDQLENLSDALDYMVHYYVFYDNLDGDPGEQFWKQLQYAVFTNPYFSAFSDNGWEAVWTNDRVAEAGSLVTGYDLKCSAYPDGLDIPKESASPYLFSSEKENISITALEDNKFRITYDMVWYSSSIDTAPGRIKVTALIKPNKDSPLDGYSIVSLQGEIIEKPSHS